MPFAPGEVVLIAAGILIADGNLSPFIFVPVACLSVLGGALTGYLWTRAIGAESLHALAERVHAGRALDRASIRLRSTGARGIGISRLIPGLRIYTSLVAGALDIDLRVFLLGAIPAIAIWVGFFTLLGALVGIPAELFLSKAGKLALDAAILLVIGLGGLVALRRIPPVERHDNALLRAPKRWRFSLALIIDVAIVASVVSGVTELVREAGGPVDADGFVDIALIIAVIVLGYTVISRRGPGATGGEALLHISYRTDWRRSV